MVMQTGAANTVIETDTTITVLQTERANISYVEQWHVWPVHQSKKANAVLLTKKTTTSDVNPKKTEWYRARNVWRVKSDKCAAEGDASYVKHGHVWRAQSNTANASDPEVLQTKKAKISYPEQKKATLKVVKVRAKWSAHDGKWVVRERSA